MRRQPFDRGYSGPDRGPAWRHHCVCAGAASHAHLWRRRCLRSSCGGVMTTPAASTRDVIVGVDAGTSLIKAVAFTRDGRQLGGCSLPNRYSTRAGGRVEQDMAQTWTDTVGALRGLGSAIPDLTSR